MSTQELERAALLVAILGVLLAVVPIVMGQSSTGEIVGQVTDASGGLVADARVEVRSTGTGESREYTTNATGGYLVTQLIPGTYEIIVTKDGFRTSRRSGLTLQVGQRARIDITLEVGVVAETIEVVAETPLLEVSEASLGQVVENRKILDLPLNGRNILSLAALTTGVTPGNGFGIGVPDGRAALIQAASANVSINGGMTAHNDVVIDGVPLSVCCQNQISFQPSIDATQEFRVRTNMYDAQYGRTGGGLITFASKGGTNEFHGSVYHFLRNEVLDANNWFNNRAGNPKGHFVYNQFGASIGGPIAANKLFFFFNYEGIRNVRGTFTSGRTPTQAERSGSFSEAIHDPLTGNSENGFTRSPFPNNQIPQSRWDPVAGNITSFWPAANTTGSNNFISNAPSSDVENQYNARIDLHATDSNRLFGRFSINRNDGANPDPYNNIASPGWTTKINNLNIVLDDTMTLSPTLIVDVRYGFAQQENVRVAFSIGTDITQFGWPQSYADALQGDLLPQIRPSGFLRLSRGTLFDRTGRTHVAVGNVTKVVGKHTLKFGGDFRAYQADWVNNGNASGTFNFNKNFTRGPDALRGSGGNEYATFLLGYPTGGSITFIEPFVSTSPYFAMYLQDDFRVSTKLTLNVGLRYDVEIPRSEERDRLSWFDSVVASPIAGDVGIPDLKGGLRFLGADGQSRQQDTDWNRFGPRFGFAYQVMPQTVIRGGYGITYLPIQTRYQSNSNQGFASSTGVVTSLDGNRTPAAQLSDPYPDGFNAPEGAAPGLLSSLGQGFGTLLRTEKNVGYSQQWSFNIQRELGTDVLFDAAYSGSKGSKLPMPLAINSLNSDLLVLEDALLESVPNPFAPFVSTGPLSRSTTTTQQLLLPHPQFRGLRSNVNQLGSSTYHSLQLKLNKRFSSGVSVLGGYTFSKLITDTAGFGTGFLDANPGFQDAYNRALDRAISPEDVSSRFVVSWVWELPFGTGRKYLSDTSRAVDQILGGWQINGIATFAAGQPIVIGNSVGTVSGATRPNNNGQSAKKSGRVQDRLDEYYETSVFTRPGPYEFGSTPRTLPDVRADGPQNFDISVFKHFTFTERVRLQFRAEFFNIFNTPQFAAAGGRGRSSNFGTSQFGRIFRTRNNPRDIQFGLRLSF